MARRTRTLDSQLESILTLLDSLRARCASNVLRALERVQTDGNAIRYHLSRRNDQPLILAILGGTGTGKSTLVNRLLDSNITATSFRRTYTAGAIAIVSDESSLPSTWLGIEHQIMQREQIPAQGTSDALSIVLVDHELTRKLSFVDTPDLDGDQPLHHAQADRVFRWADAVLFLVTPEKYQMTELLPYYRLTARYELARLFVMNKVEEQVVADDYRDQMQVESVFVLPRDDAAFEPSEQQNLAALRREILNLRLPDPSARDRGDSNRVADLIDRLRDQVLEPLRDERRETDHAIAALRAMETPPPGVDVDPLTQQLQRRLQQRSVLYLMGPGRLIDRVRQVPGILARLPRSTWDLLRSGQLSRNGASDQGPDFSAAAGVPDFRAILMDHFTVVQSRIEDVIRSTESGELRLEACAEQFRATRIEPEQAGRIADEELAALKAWLEQHWNATPRDTAMLMKLLRYLPGGERVARWSEAAPYLLAVVVAAHHAFLGPIDLLVIGGFSLATWLTEKISNQVAARARATNAAIAKRFTALAHQQIERTCRWLDEQASPQRTLNELETLSNSLSEMSAV